MTVGLVGLGCLLLLAQPRTGAQVARRRTAHVADERRHRLDREATAVQRRGRTNPTSDRLLPWAALAAVPTIGWVVGGLPGLISAAVLSPLTLATARRLVARPGRISVVEENELPLIFDLIATALRAGAPLAVAVGVVSAYVPGGIGRELDRVAALLKLGARPAEAWCGPQDHPTLAPLAAVAMRSADSGIRLADGLDRRSTILRDELRTAAVAKAERVGVMALLPLGLCFLPAFVCLGIVPVIVGVAGDIVGQFSQ